MGSQGWSFRCLTFTVKISRCFLAKRRGLGRSVFDASLDRFVELYTSGDRIVVSFSGGKDSGVMVELAVLAATMTGNLPVEVWMRDEEIMFPGTFEYARRLANRPEIKFYWFVANQAITNVCNREAPFFWTFDPEVPRDQWVREYPDDTIFIGGDSDDRGIDAMARIERFPPPPGKRLINCVGLRVSESAGRKLGLHSSKGFVTTKPTAFGAYYARPIYDWSTQDVWLAHRKFGWDYNHAYDAQWRMGLKSVELRIGPPTLNVYSINLFHKVAHVWPHWLDRVCARIPGARSVAQFGMRAVIPHRNPGETWEQTFHRANVRNAPDWIASRAIRARDAALTESYALTGKRQLPEVQGLHVMGKLSTWKKLSILLHDGDPFCYHTQGILPYMVADSFRPGQTIREESKLSKS